MVVMFSSHAYCGVRIPMPESREITNIGEDCWDQCGFKKGFCPEFCGESGVCCRQGYTGDGCNGNMGNPSKHVCTMPANCKPRVTLKPCVQITEKEECLTTIAPPSTKYQVFQNSSCVWCLTASCPNGKVCVHQKFVQELGWEDGKDYQSCLPDGSSDECELKENILIDEKTVQKSFASECQTKCQEDPSCEFFTYNKATKECGLRNFVPRGRSVLPGYVSGLKNESPSAWAQISNSVYVAKSISVSSPEGCQMICLADNNCNAMIFNQALGQCSLSYGKGPFIEIPLPNNSPFGISSCLKSK